VLAHGWQTIYESREWLGYVTERWFI